MTSYIILIISFYLSVTNKTCESCFVMIFTNILFISEGQK